MPQISKKILIVEPEVILAERLRDILAAKKFTLALVYDGERALKKIKQWRPDLIFIYSQLALLNGKKLAQALARDPLLKEIPLIGIVHTERIEELDALKTMGVRDTIVMSQLDPEAVVAKTELLVQMAHDAARKFDPFYRMSARQALHGKTVLVVEDDPLMQELLLKTLEQEGCHLKVAEDGEAALVQARQSDISLIVLDLILPGISGFEVLKALKQDHDLATIPVIVFSNLNQPDEIDQALQNGAVEFVVKSSATPAVLVDKIRDILVQRGVQHPPSLFFE